MFGSILNAEAMMEQEIPFKIFPLPRLSSSHVSAVKPVTVLENTSYFQNLKSPLGIDNTQDFIHGTQDCFTHKVSPLTLIEEENSESLKQLYFKLHNEAEKIKTWKSVIEFEIKEKESKLQEKRKMLESQRKVIKELQIENEKLKLKLHDEINQNEDLINQANATRHVCNLLKDTCDRAAERANIYQNEIDETRQIYGDLNNNIERMIMAFDELRAQAENSRHEIYNQIKYEAEKRQEMEKEHNLELNRTAKQVLELTKEREGLSSKLSALKLQLCESANKLKQLEDASKNHHSELEDYQKKTEKITQQLEEANMLLQNAKHALSLKENQLHDADAKLVEVAKENEIRKKELQNTKTQYDVKLSDLLCEIQSLKEMLVSEQIKLEEKVSELASAALETHKKSVELEDITMAYENAKNEIKHLRCDLCVAVEARKELENQLSRVTSENQTLVKKEQDLASSLANLQAQFQNMAIENTDLKTSFGDLQDVHNQLLETLKGKDEKIDVLKAQINVSAADIDHLSTKIEELKTDISSKELKYTDLKTDYEKLAKENQAIRIVNLTDKDSTDPQKNLKANKEKDQAIKKMESLEQTNTQLRSDNETLKEQLKEKDKQTRNLQNKFEDEKRNLENEFFRKEKQQKTLENKLCTLKKQIENKNKAIEELQQENKSLKKKMKEGCKQCSILKAEVSELHIQMKKEKIQHEETISTKQVEIANAKAKEEILCEEVHKLKLASDEAIKLQKETDVKCQHKITEMVALMEKHKHQYDKLIEEKDAEMCQLKSKEQETACSRALLENELSSKQNEILKLKTELQKEKEEKDKIVQEKTQPKKNIKHKDVQTMFEETPKQSVKIGTIQTSSSFSRRSILSEKLSQGEPDRKFDNKVTSPWTFSKSCKYTTPKTYSVKTPTKYAKLPSSVNACMEDPAKKKRKVSLDFEFHSDSSDNTDILGLYKNDGIFKNLHVASNDPPDTSTPRKTLTEPSIQPNLTLKVSAMKSMNQAGWAAFPKVDRRRKMKAA